MISKQRVAILTCGLGLYLAGIGFLGMGVLSQHDAAVRGFRAYLPPPTDAGSESPDAIWRARLSREDQGLADQDVGTAEQAWRSAGLAERLTAWLEPL